MSDSEIAELKRLLAEQGYRLSRLEENQLKLVRVNRRLNDQVRFLTKMIMAKGNDRN